MLRALWRPFPLADSASADTAADERERLHEVLRTHHADVWRVLRRLGVPEPSVEDAVQQVFVVATSKISRIEPGKERAFLIGAAVRIAANQRRSVAVLREHPDDDIDSHADDSPGAEELVDEKRYRALLDDALAMLPDDLRTVLVLFELEELDVSEIAKVVGIPRGTAASRLRRAREAFERAARCVRARHAFLEET